MDSIPYCRGARDVPGIATDPGPSVTTNPGRRPDSWRHRTLAVSFAIALGLGSGERPASAVILSFTRTHAPHAPVPDGDPSGLASLLAVPAMAGSITDVNVTVTLVGDAASFGGWNGDLYMYLSHAGTSTVLMNRPGISLEPPMGSPGNGLDGFTFDDEAPSLGDVHVYQSTLDFLGMPLDPTTPLTGVWEPDGRLVDPSLVTAGAPRTALLDVFDGGVPGGDWLLFVADLSPGLSVSLASWRLDLTITDPIQPEIIPEPVSGTPLAAGVAVLLGLGWWRFRRATRP